MFNLPIYAARAQVKALQDQDPPRPGDASMVEYAKNLKASHRAAVEKLGSESSA